nr:1-phosphatidylinositol-4-phosphate 5-kinase [Volvox reticuliferus]
MAEDEYATKTKQFGNGDVYNGTWSQSGLPDGEGKYTWQDGSMYDGSWKDGVRHGIGKYTWASGATYHGEWRDGCMSGVGTWESPDGLSRYQGGWLRDSKHGLGRQVYGSGDVYEGLWKQGAPGGPGRYVYWDGNEYDGEWRGGRMHGQGTFVWRSGERYDGEWKDGRMDGAGVFSAADGSLYDGRWRRGRKHGLGIFRPSPTSQQQQQQQQAAAVAANGFDTSISTFSLRRGVGMSVAAMAAAAAAATAAATAAVDPSPGVAPAVGNGAGGGGVRGAVLGRLSRSTCPHHQTQTHTAAMVAMGPAAVPLPAGPAPPADEGCVVSGHVAAGQSTGVGVIGAAAPIPASGAPGAGMWPGAPPPAPGRSGRSGSGVANEGNGVRTAGAAVPASASKLVFVRVYDKGRLLRETALSADELDALLPGGLGVAAGWSKGAREDRGPNPRGQLLRMLRGGGRGVAGAPGSWPRPWSVAGGAMGTGMGPRLGDPVTRAHPAYPLMVALQLGIRYSVGRISHEPLPRNTTTDEYGLRVQQEFPRGGSEMTPVHPGEDFTWSDYAPITFRRLRESFGVDASTYMLSLCSDHSLRHLISPGKSGSVFFLSQDERFFLKTMSRAEMSVFLSLLPAYHRHVERHPHTLLCRFFGLHGVTTSGGRKYRFVVMSNIFRTPLQLHRKYDLKGSTLGRTAGRPPSDDPSVIFKDLDLDLKLRLEAGWRDRLLFQLRADCGLLSGSGVMDYSLLVGVHFRSKAPPAAQPHPQQPLQHPGGEVVDAEGAGFPHASAPPSAPAVEGEHRQQQLQNEMARMHERLQRLRPRLGEVGSQDLSDLITARMRLLTPGALSREAWASIFPSSPPPLSTATRTDAEDNPHRNGHSSTAPGRGRGSAGVPAPEPLSLGAAAAAAATASTSAATEGFSASEELALSCGQSRVQLGVNMAATAVHPDGREEPVVLWFAIIDILQPYNTTKKLEHGLKSVLHAAHSISVTPPSTYASRFQAFMKQVFE